MEEDFLERLRDNPRVSSVDWELEPSIKSDPLYRKILVIVKSNINTHWSFKSILIQPSNLDVNLTLYNIYFRIADTSKLVGPLMSLADKYWNPEPNMNKLKVYKTTEAYDLVVPEEIIDSVINFLYTTMNVIKNLEE